MHLNGLRKIPTFTEKEYLSSGVNVLTKGLKILESTKTNISELTFPQSDGKMR